MTKRNLLCAGPLLAMLALGCGAPPELDGDLEVQSDELRASELWDFLVQDVCVDAAGAVVRGDPGVCPRRRDMQIDDPITYAHADLRGRASSYPTQCTNGAPCVVWLRDFLGGRLDFDRQPGEGSDIGEAQGAWVSTLNTEDPGGERYYYSRGANGGCVLEDGWVYMPTNVLAAGGPRSGSVLREGTVVPAGRACDGRFNVGRTWWQYRRQFRFRNDRGGDKTLETIVSRQGAVDAQGEFAYFEEVYFTRPYGFTRWITWKACSNGSCPEGVPAEARACGLAEPTQVVGPRRFGIYRCGDVSDGIDLPASQWRSTYSWPIRRWVSGSINNLRNPDFSRDLATQTRTTEHWSVSSNAGASLTAEQGAFGSGYLRASCNRPSCGMNAVFSIAPVDRALIEGRQMTAFGARLWTEPRFRGRTATVRVLERVGGQWTEVAAAPATLDETPRLFQFRGRRPKVASDAIRFEVRLAGSAADTTLMLDDAYVAFRR